MKKELIGILIFMLLIGTALPITGQVVKNEIIKGSYENNSFLNNDRWMKTYGGRLEDEAWSVQQTSDGGYIIVGSTSSEKNEDFDMDIYLIKTDSKGNKLWDKTFGGEYWEEGYSVKQTIDGGYILTGSFGSIETGSIDVWLIKTDSNGNMLWNKTFDNDGDEGGIDVIEISQGEFIILGGHYGYIENVSIAVWLIKTDPEGNKIWDKLYDNYFGVSIQETNDEGYVIAGSYPIIGITSDILLLKIDHEGELLWDKKFNKSHVDHGKSVQQTSDGGFIISGETHLDSHDDVWLIKTDSEGELMWDKTFGGKRMDFGNSVQQTIDGGYIIGGWTQGFLNNDGMLIKTDSNGEKEWIKTYDYSRVDEINSVQQTSDGGFILTGRVLSNIFFCDIWLVKTDSNGDVPRNRGLNRSSSGLFERLLIMFPLIRSILQRFEL